MKLLSALIISFTIFTSATLKAGGFDYNTVFGTRTYTLNGLYYAGSAGLGSVFSNPAGLSLLGGYGLEISVMNKIEQNEFENTDRGFYKSYNNENYNFGGGAYWNISEQFTIAAAYHPVIDYRVDWPFVVLRGNDVVAFSMMNRFEINSISPALAFHSGPFYIGIAGNIYQAVNQLNFPRNNLDTIGFADYQFEYDIDAWAFGGTLGLLYDINEFLRIGLTARSGFKIDFKGEAESLMFTDLFSAPPVSDVSSKFEIPWKFGLGFLYSLNENINLNLDLSYSLWESTGESRDFIFGDPAWNNNTTQIDSLSGFSSSSIPLNFNNSLDLGFGFEYNTQNGLIYRAGYRFSQSPASASTFSFLFPTGDQNIITAGIGYKEDKLTIDAAIAYNIGITKTVEQSESRYLFGDYFTDGYTPSITLRYEF